MTESQARQIASKWHGGQGSALYAFASSGYFDAERLSIEVAQCRRQIEAGAATYDESVIGGLDGLGVYVERRGDWEDYGYSEESR